MLTFLLLDYLTSTRYCVQVLLFWTSWVGVLVPIRGVRNATTHFQNRRTTTACWKWLELPESCTWARYKAACGARSGSPRAVICVSEWTPRCQCRLTGSPGYSRREKSWSCDLLWRYVRSYVCFTTNQYCGDKKLRWWEPNLVPIATLIIVNSAWSFRRDHGHYMNVMHTHIIVVRYISCRYRQIHD